MPGGVHCSSTERPAALSAWCAVASSSPTVSGTTTILGAAVVAGAGGGCVVSVVGGGTGLAGFVVGVGGLAVVPTVVLGVATVEPGS